MQLSRQKWSGPWQGGEVRSCPEQLEARVTAPTSHCVEEGFSERNRKEWMNCHFCILPCRQPKKSGWPAESSAGGKQLFAVQFRGSQWGGKWSHPRCTSLSPGCGKEWERGSTPARLPVDGPWDLKLFGWMGPAMYTKPHGSFLIKGLWDGNWVVRDPGGCLETTNQKCWGLVNELRWPACKIAQGRESSRLGAVPKGLCLESG